MSTEERETVLDVFVIPLHKLLTKLNRHYFIQLENEMYGSTCFIPETVYDLTPVSQLCLGMMSRTHVIVKFHNSFHLLCSPNKRRSFEVVPSPMQIGPCLLIF